MFLPALVYVMFGQSLLPSAQELDLSRAVIVTRAGELPKAEQTAAHVLEEEVRKRTGLAWPVMDRLPDSGVAVAIAGGVAGLKPEGFRFWVDASTPQRTVVRIDGADARGALFGVGYLLRTMQWRPGVVRIAANQDLTTSPAYPIRGHQLGYRHTANSYDAWDERQYDQYIRDLVLFGTNTVETIPFQDEDSPVMPVPRNVMNVKIGEICDRYDVDHWVWTPVVFDLNDAKQRADELDKWEAFYKACPRLDAVFFPGGDPGDNPPELVLPFLEEATQRLVKHHPKAGMWISLQGFTRDQVDFFYRYLDEKKPAWLAGVVSGPQSAPIIETRRRLPARFRHRLYPDITHTVLCQYPVPWWDSAFALTLGREPVNPRPRFYAHIHNCGAPYSDGFSTYSDGINDDANKIVWSALGWDPKADVRDILVQYARCFFRPDLAEAAADGIFALESNWEGGLAQNGSIEATFAFWSDLERKASEFDNNWRWRAYLLRAYYDAFTRHRLIYETRLEQEAHRVLADAKTRGAGAAMDAALEILKRADTAPCEPELRARIEAHGAALFKLIGFQTSVERYHAKNYERGAVLDFLDRPLNNRWWLEDEFERIRALPSESEKAARLEVIRTWEDPGPGGFYDDVGNVAKSPHVLRGESVMTDPDMLRARVPGFGTWMDNGRSRWRLSWLCSMDWPVGVLYEGLEPDGAYTLRMTGKGDVRPHVNGERIEPAHYSKQIGEFKEYAVPKALLKDGKILLTFEDLPEEAQINWREQSMLTEAWLLKSPVAH